jgi:hypothetical protein
MRVITLLPILCCVALTTQAQQPIIDVHVHGSLPSNGGLDD